MDNSQSTTIVKNAGIVIITSFIPSLFTRLDLTVGKQFKDNESREKAALYLQYLVTGQQINDDYLLPLNKVLCGLAMNEPIKESIEVTSTEKELVEGLLKATVNYWPSIGQTSVNGFRGNWLVRDGFIIENEERWELVVEKRAYDMLLNRSPFTFSIVKFPWMNKPLYVNWQY
ncbi:contractile injection system tape measure protein [Flavobacterium sp. NRK1]|uniref:contractile injection system tape measure protein n=1 Tax=Flavobacterium sp. NRK1 TaxID=2954929 RepID=UPI0020933C61|nr:contractile injection system tape measure protein [Flavobacterium sp. NRK1]MCO6146789.1 contractile injection system tape measure protein [Flavobacterium sp. NRK1]